jgi:hypothetical protein
LGFSTAQAQATRVAEKVVETVSKASRADEMWVNLGLGGLPVAERATRLNAMVAQGDATAETVARQLRVFENAVRGGTSVEEAFKLAFVRAGEVVSAANLHKFSAASAQQTSDVLSGILDQVETSDQRGAPSCGTSMAALMNGADLSSFNTALRTLELRKGASVLGSASCALKDAEMAQGLRRVLEASENQILLKGSQISTEDAIETGYAEVMKVDHDTAVTNLKTLQNDCHVFGSGLAFN